MNHIKIKISTAGGGKPFMRQLPSGIPEWGNCHFSINEDVAECDLWVVYGGLGKEERTFCPADATLFITNEPPSVKKYQKRFLNQFAAVIGCDRTIKHPNIIFKQQALPWWVGHKVGGEGASKTYDELKSIHSIPKLKLLSVIASNKTFTKGHKKRYHFVKKLKEELGDNIDVFGTGFNQIEDKWDAIAPYKYHITLENSTYPDYWTEKLADAFLGRSYPIYYGCPNIYDYFPKNALTAIDIDQPEEAIGTIRKIIKSEQYERSVEDIEKAKNLILDTYQLFPMLATYATTHQSTKEKVVTTLIPEKQSFLTKLVWKITSTYSPK